MHQENYGFIKIDNLAYYKKDNGDFAVSKFLIRKPIPKEHIKINHLTGEEYDDRLGIFLWKKKRSINLKRWK